MSKTTNSKLKSPNYKILHLCNYGTPEVSSWHNIVSKNQLENWNGEDDEIVWLINAQLSWESNDLSYDYGFDIAIYLRLVKKSKAALIIYSPVSRNYFETKSKNDKKYLILFGRGSRYIESPFKINELTELIQLINPLTNESLHDVSTMLCNLKGIVVDRLNHDLKFVEDPQIVDEVIENITPYLSNYQKQLIEIDIFSENLKERIISKDEEGYFVMKQQFLNLCNLYLNESIEKKEQQDSTRFKVLILEDNINELKDFCDNLENSFDIIPVDSAMKAKFEIENDMSNNILAVISDWRLYTNVEKTYWQDLQGYEVLELAANNGFRALFALTSQADFVVHQIRNLMSIRFHILKKENLRKSNQWQLFRDLILEQCNEVIKIRASLPASKNWIKDVNKNGNPIKSLKQQYIEVWNSDERDNYFFRISDRADEIWSYFEKEYKNNYKKLKALNTEFGIQLSTTKLELEPVLVLRRIWMALWYNQIDTDLKLSRESINLRSEKIYEMMFAPGYQGDKGISANQTVYKLCLEIFDIQRKIMLPEERSWLIEKELL